MSEEEVQLVAEELAKIEAERLGIRDASRGRS
jgi:hypothetical protein